MGRDRQNGTHRSCVVCGKAFYVTPSEIASRPAKYCSLACAGYARRLTNQKGRNSWRTIAWRQEVFERDQYTCQHCGQRGGELNAHHIKGWTKYPHLRFDLGNGLTLCVNCHIAHHQRFGYQ
jgi:hypothetical protein